MNEGEQSNFHESIRAERKTVRFFDGLEVDGYRMPNGAFRVGLPGVSRTLGYDREWLPDAVDMKTPRTAKALQDLGFSENISKVTAQSIQGNPYEDRTISLDDFNCCIIYAVQQNKSAAIALNKAFTQLALTDFFRDAFGELPLTIEEKRQQFYEAYAKSISPEMWSELQKEDILRLALAGDHLYFPEYRDWENISPWRRVGGTSRKITQKQVNQPSLEL
jgi:hypothetical protein